MSRHISRFRRPGLSPRRNNINEEKKPIKTFFQLSTERFDTVQDTKLALVTCLKRLLLLFIVRRFIILATLTLFSKKQLRLLLENKIKIVRLGVAPISDFAKGTLLR